MMNKPDNASSDQEKRAEYDFSGGIRGSMPSAMQKAATLLWWHLILVKQFPTSQAVNEALRRIVKQRQD